jgi:hypothetical protein
LYLTFLHENIYGFVILPTLTAVDSVVFYEKTGFSYNSYESSL